MRTKKKIYTLLYIAFVSSFIASFISYVIPGGIKELLMSYLPIRVAKRISYMLLLNPVEFSNLTVGFMGVLITFSIFAGISLIFISMPVEKKGKDADVQR